ncbi:DUF262 domain-containing protein [Fibrella aquatilis]|uniref:DUF262 domain-containing protein n=1 Tax=Fibrella aquatilis TaxID=2817059 RepID=A0A939K1R9_9BACT|nr:DUF262 domain-containing protein [Fibrella aquatilis]MBO0932545.1 DUF262 domain-containing protein [Fibrella aquatilis]
MIQSANNYELSILFNPDQNLKYTIPKYQREYVWQQRNWEAMFDDVWENDKGHFFGSIICINQSVDVHQTLRLELVDGQQRTTTTSLLYAAIYTWLNQNAVKTDRRVMVQETNTLHRLVHQPNYTALRLEPSRQGGNYDDYQWVMANAGILDKEVHRPPNVGKRRIYRAYDYFLNRLNQLDTDGIALFDTPKVLAFLDKLNGASMVQITVNSHSDAFTLFETLNNRGEPLSALDLIKNKFLDVLDQKQVKSIEQNFDTWTKLLDNLTDDPRTQQRYLRHYYNSFKYKQAVRVTNISKATRSNLIDIYGKLIDRDVQWIFNDLYAKSKLYGRLVKPENDYNSQPITNTLLDLERIGGVTSIGFLLYLLAEHPDLNSPELAAIIRLLVIFMVRRNITDTPPTRDLDKLFIDLIEYCQQLDETPTAEDVKAFLKKPEWYVSNEIFRGKLEGNLYYENTDATRFVLCFLEAHYQTRETQKDLWQRYGSGQYVWTIEHILPQGKNIPADWVTMITDGDEQLAKQVQEQNMHTLGNLTISGYNSTLSNLPFGQKRDRKDNKGLYVGYRNGLHLNKELANKEKWTIADIQERTNQLVDQILTLFNF